MADIDRSGCRVPLNGWQCLTATRNYPALPRRDIHPSPDIPDPETKVGRQAHRDLMRERIPRFLRLLTTIHALGALACFVMAIGCSLSPEFRDALAVSGGSKLMVQVFGPGTGLFLLFVGFVLATLAYASWRTKPWAWELTLIVYGIGVLGSLWQVSLGIKEGWLAAIVNGAVVVYASRPAVRRAYHQT